MSIEKIFNNLSRELVWEKHSTRIKKASLTEHILFGDDEIFEEKVYGLGIGIERTSFVLDFYISNDFDYLWLEKNLRQKGVVYKRKYIKTEGFKEFASYTTNPILISGDSVKHQRLRGYGTLGGFMSDITSNYRLAISNNHVFALYNRGKLNDPLLRYKDKSQFGGLYKFINLYKPPFLNTVDAACGWIYDNQGLKWAWKRPKQTSRVLPGMEVYKIGATTGYTEGIIIHTRFSQQVNYKGLGNINFMDCISIRGKIGRPFSAPGDSGSFVFTKSHRVIGMIFAGNEDENISFANKITNIENQLGVYIP